ncbi:DUF5684 domain-containing protein [Microbacterium sp. LTA6]|uniref:large exoprotein n=1 Tax=unclassified Microbacterium TaxID=2609290 RepID=UPI00313930C7
MYQDDASVYAALAGVYFVLFLFAIVFYVIASIFMMKIFEKAGVQGKWRAWVPVYNTLIFAKLGDISPWVVLILFGVSFIPFLNFLTGIGLAIVMALAAWRVGLKLQKDAVWVVLYVLLSIVWLGINAFDKSRWNSNIAPAPWAGNSFMADSTVWQGIPVQSSAAAAPQGYGAAPQGYAPPAPQGYAPPAQPGYAPPVAPSAPATSAPSVPPVPPTTPPAPPAAPPAPPAAPPVNPTPPPA